MTTVDTLGTRIEDRRKMLKLDRAGLAALLGVDPEVVARWEEDAGASQLTIAEIEKVAAALGTSPALLWPEPGSDLDGGVKIQMPTERPVLAGRRGGVDYYTYNCLIRTTQAPSLIPLVVDVLVDDPEAAQLNAGHGGNEFLYVLSGDIDMAWESDGVVKRRLLPQGASMFIAPYVRHSFTAVKGSGPAQLLAVNF